MTARRAAAMVDPLASRIDAIEARLSRLEQRDGRGPRDDADRALLLVLADVVGESLTFTSGEVFQHARLDERLADALRDADVDNPVQLGRLLQRLEAHPIDSIAVERVCGSRAGVRWRLRGLRG